MSLEKAIADLTEEVKGLREEMATMKANIGGANAKAGGSTKAADKPKTETKKTDKEPTLDDLVKVAGPYLKSGTTKDEKNRINATVKPILEHLGGGKVSEIPPENFGEAIALFKKLHAAYEDGGIEAAEELDLELSNEDPDAGGDSDLL